MKLKSFVAAAIIVSLSQLGASAQTGNQRPIWTSPDGGLRFGAPAGWTKGQIPAGSDLVLAVSKKESSSTMYCNVTMKPFGLAQPGVTQAFINARLREGASSISMADQRVSTAGGIVIIDGFLDIMPRLQIIMKAMYVRGGKMHDVDVTCIRSDGRSKLTAEDLKTARQFFDTISVSP